MLKGGLFSFLSQLDPGHSDSYKDNLRLFHHGYVVELVGMCCDCLVIVYICVSNVYLPFYHVFSTYVLHLCLPSNVLFMDCCISNLF